ncbi:MAG: peroxide stress protein YaaA [Desulfobulbaceae bacterium]|uniref:UPF0246 protein H8E79_01135 n=1 Tax=Candidatus Desulfatifera sulfidica TaxID=2841691 RepID=A0A8J6T9F5_9BACT|nr:peroxide stress protein YaaA [Candidatus Desulfatifera sulfidica]
MLLLISPSKTQSIVGPSVEKYTLPDFLPEVTTLVKQLQVFDRNGLAHLMNMSEKLSDLTWTKFKTFSKSFTSENARQAILTFQGDVYSGIKSEQFSIDDFEFVQSRLRIISGLYGLLKPLDLIQPYRLEMKTKLKTDGAANLYEFWGNKITELLNHELEKTVNSYLVNLASQEYFKAVNPAFLKKPVLDIVFKVKKNNQYKTIGIYAKRARGLMVNFVIENRLVDVQGLKEFEGGGFRYNKKLSGELQWFFCKE